MSARREFATFALALGSRRRVPRRIPLRRQGPQPGRRPLRLEVVSRRHRRRLRARQPALDGPRPSVRAVARIQPDDDPPGPIAPLEPPRGLRRPHLANAQSAPFDPFHLIAYVGTLPRANAWIAAARLWVAGLGMFLLAGTWGLGGWGRWFAGLAYPFCGFMIVWLLFPVTSVAVWMPWLFWATDRVLIRPEARRAGVLAVVVGFLFLGGHIQTSAHALLAAGAYAAFRLARERLGGARFATCCGPRRHSRRASPSA